MFNKIDKVLKKQLNKSNLNNVAQAAHICYVANQVLEPKYQALSFKNDVLTVGSKSSIDALTLQMNSTQMINKINEKLGRKFISKIRYKVLN